MYISNNQTNLFSTSSTTSNAAYSLFAKSNYYKTISKYAIASKYGHGTSSNKNQVENKKTLTDEKKAEAKKATDFLTGYTDNYKALEQASTTLKSTLNDSKSTTQAKVEAVSKYVDSYNDTLKFLSEHSSNSTYSLNILKNSLNNIDPLNYGASSETGISKNKDGSLALDTKVLNSALTKNEGSVVRQLSSLASVTSAHTNISSNLSKATLLKEQNLMQSTATTSTSSNDTSYNNFMKMAKNTTALNNYYFNLGAAGIFMDISI